MMGDYCICREGGGCELCRVAGGGMTKRQKRVKSAIEYLKKYINTYENQKGYLDYADGTIIDDILYGLGVALDEEKYKFGNGYDRFKLRLLDHIGPRERLDKIPC